MSDLSSPPDQPTPLTDDVPARSRDTPTANSGNADASTLLSSASSTSQSSPAAAAPGEREFGFTKAHAQDFQRNWVFQGRLWRGLRGGIFVLGLLSSALPAAVAAADRDSPEDEARAGAGTEVTEGSSAPVRPDSANAENERAAASVGSPRSKGDRSALGNSIIFFASLAATIYTAVRTRLMFPVGDLYRDAAEDLSQAIHSAEIKYMRFAHVSDLEGIRSTVNDLEKRLESLRKALRRDIAKIRGKKGDDNDNA